MENKLLVFALLTIIINKSFESPVISEWNNLDNLVQSPQRINWKRWESWTQINDFTETVREEITEDQKPSTVDSRHPCGPLIVKLDQHNYFLQREKVQPIICNAYFVERTDSKCNDGSILYAEFNLKINGKLLIKGYMKRTSMNYEGFYSKFIINPSMLRDVPQNNKRNFSAVCDVTITSDAGSAVNKSYESRLNVDNSYKNFKPTEEWNHMISSTERYDKFNKNQSIIKSMDSCRPIVSISESFDLFYKKNGNTTFKCWVNFPKHCNQSLISKAKYELIIDGMIEQRRVLNKSSIRFLEFYAEFEVQNSEIKDLSEIFDKPNTYCYVHVEIGSVWVSSSSLSIGIRVNEDRNTDRQTVTGIPIELELKNDMDSPLNGSCSYPKKCIANRNLTCDWDQKCKCIYDHDLKAYYVPYKHSNEWYCARPAKHNEQCFHNNQCKQTNKGSVCTQTDIGKVCECDQMYYWNGFKCVSVNEDEVETTTSFYSFTDRLHSHYGYTTIIGFTFAGILGGYLFIVLALRLFIRNKKKQLNREQSVNQVFRKKQFVPHILISGKCEDKKEIIKDDKIAKIRIVE